MHVIGLFARGVPLTHVPNYLLYALPVRGTQAGQAQPNQLQEARLPCRASMEPSPEGRELLHRSSVHRVVRIQTAVWNLCVTGHPLGSSRVLVWTQHMS